MKAFSIGDCVVEPQLNQVRCHGGSPCRVEAKVMEVLLYLAKHSNEVVSKQRLLDSVWQDVTVSEDALFRCIKELRLALGDNSREPEYIETIPKRGYRLIQRVVPAPASDLSDNEGQSTTVRNLRIKGYLRPRLLALALILLVIIAALSRLIVGWLDSGPSPHMASLAVIPFEVEGSQNADLPSENLSSLIAYRLSSLPELKIVSSILADRFRLDSGFDPSEASTELGAEFLLLGRISPRNDGFIVSVELIKGSTRELIWGETYRADYGSLEVAQARISSDVSHLLFSSGSRSALGPEPVDLPRTVSARPSAGGKPVGRFNP